MVKCVPRLSVLYQIGWIFDLSNTKQHFIKTFYRKKMVSFHYKNTDPTRFTSYFTT